MGPGGVEAEVHARGETEYHCLAFELPMDHVLRDDKPAIWTFHAPNYTARPTQPGPGEATPQKGLPPLVGASGLRTCRYLVSA